MSIFCGAVRVDAASFSLNVISLLSGPAKRPNQLFLSAGKKTPRRACDEGC
jgi:hypothetical protein